VRSDDILPPHDTDLFLEDAWIIAGSSRTQAVA